MYAGTILGAALALCGTTMAVPAAAAANGLRPRDGDNDNDLQNAPWVTVDDEGAPRTTFTPTVTTISGTPSAVNAAPHDLTATVYTMTNYGHVYTTTQAPPNPTATNAKTNEGAFSRCYNKEGPYAPFCRPRHNSSIYIDNTYYVTWDPDWFNKTSNKTRFVSLRINYFNDTTGEKSDRDILQQWQPARYGFLPFKVEGRHLRGHNSNNVTLQLVGHEIQNTTAPTVDTVELPVVIAKAPFDPMPPSQVPKGQTLVIALPVTFGAIALLVVGLCLWNRKTRRIQLGNVMSRSRRGYTGRRTRNLLNRKNDGIQLGAPVSPPVDYRDIPERPRRDSEALGSLSGSPVRAHFEEQDTTGGRRNAFRDEVGRQERERRTGTGY